MRLRIYSFRKERDSLSAIESFRGAVLCGPRPFGLRGNKKGPPGTPVIELNIPVYFFNYDASDKEPILSLSTFIFNK